MGGQDIYFDDLRLDVLASVEEIQFGNRVMNGTNGNDYFDLSAVQTFSSFIRIDLYGGNDTFFGSEDDDIVDAGGDDDTLWGNNGDDTLSGNDGEDILIGGAGADHRDGGDGIDTASYEDATQRTVANLLNDARNRGAAEGDTYEDIENLIGGNERDYLSGNGGSNHLTGLDGRDTIYGRVGADWLQGDEGNDYLSGGNGNDTLDGGVGNDSLIGGAGNDILNGGEGDDSMFAGAGADTFIYNGGADRIIRFRAEDALHLDNVLWGETALTPEEILDFAEVVGSDLVFDFGNGNTLTMAGFRDTEALEPLLVIV